MEDVKNLLSEAEIKNGVSNCIILTNIREQLLIYIHLYMH